LSSTWDPEKRSFALIARDLCSVYPELTKLVREHHWTLYPRLGAILIDLEQQTSQEALTTLVRLLRGVLDPPRLQSLRGAWIDSRRELEDQVQELIHAEPLLQLEMGSGSPLVEILNQRRIETWFQPIYRSGTGAVWGYECLMRGRTLEGELVMPSDLLAWARRENLLFLLDHCCRQIHLANAVRLPHARQCHFLVNFLPNSIYWPSFSLEAAIDAVNGSGLHPDQIVFEVVETEEVRDRDHLRRILAHYRKFGFKVALDDVGSGYSGLSLLGDLNPDLIKIDRELVRKAATSGWHRGICESLVHLAKRNDRLVLAEGIETEEERLVMETMGADLFQGYLFGRPAPQPAAGGPGPVAPPRSTVVT
jgi:EAL domain-containing protein (putative c-di-GMP-specific phosphodiesterase class I)